MRLVPSSADVLDYADSEQNTGEVMRIVRHQNVGDENDVADENRDD